MPSHKHTLYVYNDDFSNGGDDASFENKKKKPGFTYDVGQSAGSWSYTQISNASYLPDGVTADNGNLPPYRNVMFYKRTA